MFNGDHTILARLLPALGGRYGSGVFTVKEVLENIVFRELLGDMSPSRLGSMLARAVDRDFAGLTVVRSTTEHNARLWAIACTLP